MCMYISCDDTEHWSVQKANKDLGCACTSCVHACLCLCTHLCVCLHLWCICMHTTMCMHVCVCVWGGGGDRCFMPSQPLQLCQGERVTMIGFFITSQRCLCPTEMPTYHVLLQCFVGLFTDDAVSNLLSARFCGSAFLMKLKASHRKHS